MSPICSKVGLLALAMSIAACGSHRGSSTENAGGNGNGKGDGGEDQQDPDGGRKDGSSDASGDADTRPDTGAGCKTTCASDDCGAVPDGCGTFLACSECGQGLVCGLYESNKCGAPAPTACTPKSAAEVCTGKCGAVSDQCSGIVMCDGNNGGVTCGANQACTDAACVDVGSSCTPLTCQTKHHQCGDDGDGCGGILHCGDCATGEQCNFSVNGNTCGTLPPPQCTAKSLAEACTNACGKVGDGCGGTLDCESSPLTACPSGQSCGGGGTPGQCGGGMTCTPLNAADVCDGKCGSQSDGCGGTYACNGTNGGQVCNSAIGESCGGGGTPNVCGKPVCVAKTPAELCPYSGTNKSCGAQPDGCGGLVDCGVCDVGQQCGLFAVSRCGTMPTGCTKTAETTACAGKCGTVADGCGGSYTCDSSNGGVVCTGNEYCGANMQANKCGAPAVSCVPKTCAQLGHSCGLASDGCGHVLNCWPTCNVNDPLCTGSCGTNASCLGNQVTGAQSCVSGGPSCTGSLCSSLPTNCSVNAPTKLTGKVVTPGRVISGSTLNQLPVPNALVYIPAEPSVALPTIGEGVQAGNSASCGRCEDEKLVADGQSVLAAAVTNFKGEFTLEGRIPVGVAFKLVIKVGKWRRVVSIGANVAQACQSVALTVEQTRLNASSTDGLTGTHLPKIAVSTGDVDAMECVLLGMGIAQSEFTLPSGTGRIHMYRANGTMMPSSCTGTYVNNRGRTTQCSSNSNSGCRSDRTGCSWLNPDANLYASQAALNAYDLVVFDCEGGGHYARGATERNRVLDYANNGGRVFASHWSYEWLDNTGTMDMAAAWNSGGTDQDTSDTSYVSLPSGPTARTGANAVKSLLYRDWLDWQGALTGSTAGTLTNPNPPRMTVTDPRRVAGTSVGSSTDEWMYRSNGSQAQQLSFNTPYAAAESAICGRVAFSAFHVASTSTGSQLDTSSTTWPNECNASELTPQEKTLAFMLFDLATCVSAGDPPQPPSCVPKTTSNVCPGANDACGFVSDGCGGVVDCAGCAAGFYCDGSTCRPQTCTPATCASLGFTCGNHADGCGGVARNAQGVEGCGTCTGGQTCGLTTPGLCGGCVQIPMNTACPAGSCGVVSDGCGGTYDCGVCTAGQVCGGGGPNTCGPGTCTPNTSCGTKNCGVVADGCGGTVSCGSCTSPDTCGGGGAPNVCGHPTCVPKTVQQVCPGLECGWVSDGCGGAVNCGTCPNNATCGGNGPNKCGSTSCQPVTCDVPGSATGETYCGTIADQCGSLLNCGSCPAGQVCGATAPNRCGPGSTCTPRNCTQAGAECGLVGDGCGGVLNCGTCTSPETCGGAGVSNQCGTGQGGCNKLTCGNVQCGQASDGCGGLLDCGGCPSGNYCQDGACYSVPI